MAALADLRAVLVRAAASARRWLDPIFGAADHLLSVHAAGLAAPRRLADDAVGRDLRHRGVLRRRQRRHAACSAARRRRRAAAARRLDRVRRRAAVRWRCRSISVASSGCSTTIRFSPASTYTDAHVAITGMLIVAVGAACSARRSPSSTPSSAPQAALAGRRRSSRRPCATSVVGVVGWYVNSFIVKPNELVRERPFIAHNIEMTRQAFALDRIEQHAVPGRDRPRGASTPRTTRTRSRTSGCGTGARCRTRCGRSRRSAPITISPTSTSTATRSTATSGR